MKKTIPVIIIVALLLLNIMPVFAETSYYIQVGAFSTHENAEKQETILNELGLASKIIKINNLHKVFVGPFSSKSEAITGQDIISEKGLSSFLVLESKMYDAPEPVVIPVTPTEEPLEIPGEEVVDEPVDEVATEPLEESADAPTDALTDGPIEELIITKPILALEEDEDENTINKLLIISLIIISWMLFIVVVIYLRLKKITPKDLD